MEALNISGYSIDESMDQEGVWREIKHGHKIKVSPLDNPLHRKVKKQVETKYYGKRPDMDRVSEKAKRQCNIEQIVRGCLRDWSLSAEQGFDMELAVSTMLAWENRKFANAVIEEILDVTNDAEEELSDDLGN